MKNQYSHIFQIIGNGRIKGSFWRLFQKKRQNNNWTAIAVKPCTLHQNNPKPSLKWSLSSYYEFFANLPDCCKALCDVSDAL